MSGWVLVFPSLSEKLCSRCNLTEAEHRLSANGRNHPHQSHRPLPPPPTRQHPPPQPTPRARSELYRAQKEWNFSSLTWFHFTVTTLPAVCSTFDKHSLTHSLTSTSKQFCRVNTHVKCSLKREVILVSRKLKGQAKEWKHRIKIYDLIILLMYLLNYFLTYLRIYLITYLRKTLFPYLISSLFIYLLTSLLT